MKVMFICTGNICRSAMAHAMLNKKVKDENKNIEVYSCGIFAENGDYPTSEAVEVMREYGIDLTSHRATNIRQSDIEKMDVILCATLAHKNNVLNMYPHLEGKVYTMKEYAGLKEKNMDIKDPWGYDINTYRRCASEIEKCIENL